MTKPGRDSRILNFYPQLPSLLRTQPAPPWLHPDSVECWGIASPERDHLCISRWGAFLSHDTVIHQAKTSWLLYKPSFTAVSHVKLINLYQVLQSWSRLIPVFCIFFLEPIKIWYHFNLVKSPSRIHHLHGEFSLPWN